MPKESSRPIIKIELTKTKLKEVLSGNHYERISEFTLEQLLRFNDDNYKNVFLFTVRHCSLETLRELVNVLRKMPKEEFEEFIHCLDDFNRNAVMIAARRDSQEKLSFLINELGIDLNIKNPHDRRAITYAIRHNCPRAFEWLLLNGSKFREKEERNIGRYSEFKSYFNSPSCFLAIVASGNLSAFRFIMRHVEYISPEKKQLFIDALDNSNRNALMLAAKKKSEKMVNVLVELPFKLELEDMRGRTALYYVSKQGYMGAIKTLLEKTKEIDKHSAEYIKKHVDTLVARTKKNKKEIINSLTSSPEKIKQKGRIPKISKKEIKRRPRSFACERERQLLKQASTQLYFKLKKEFPKELKEVQMMHLAFGDKNFLFIAMNESSLSKQASKTLSSREELEKILIKPYTSEGAEGKRRSERYATKIFSRVYSDDSGVKYFNKEDEMRTKQIRTLLKTGSLSSLRIRIGAGNILSEGSKERLKTIFRDENDHIYLIVAKCPNVLKQRHAEEWLTDVAEYAAKIHKRDKIKTPLYTCIAGKKRPCMGCAARMQNVINQYSDRPGRCFTHTVENQGDEVAARTATLLLSKSSHVTRTIDKKLNHSYDSASDSEPSTSERRSAGSRLSTTLKKTKEQIVD